MKTFLASVLALSTIAIAEPAKVDFQPDDTVKSLLERQVGQKVEVQLKNGQKLGGKVEHVGGKSLHLSSLAGQEFYDAVVDLEQVAAVAVRVK